MLHQALHTDPQGFELISTVTEGIGKLNDASISVIVVTSPSNIAHG
jgi:hypothetical protein